MEFVLKKLNQALTKVVAAMPSSMRYLFADMKKILNELILCLYNKITGKLCDFLKGILNKALGIEDLDNKNVAISSKSPVEWVDEESYFLKLSKSSLVVLF